MVAPLRASGGLDRPDPETACVDRQWGRGSIACHGQTNVTVDINLESLYGTCISRTTVSNSLPMICCGQHMKWHGLRRPAESSQTPGMTKSACLLSHAEVCRLEPPCVMEGLGLDGTLGQEG